MVEQLGHWQDWSWLHGRMDIREQRSLGQGSLAGQLSHVSVGKRAPGKAQGLVGISGLFALPRCSFWGGYVWTGLGRGSACRRAHFLFTSPLGLAQCSQGFCGSKSEWNLLLQLLIAVHYHLAAWVEGHQTFVLLVNIF